MPIIQEHVELPSASLAFFSFAALVLWAVRTEEFRAAGAAAPEVFVARPDAVTCRFERASAVIDTGRGALAARPGRPGSRPHSA
jgi:hypothetical protein